MAFGAGNQGRSETPNWHSRFRGLTTKAQIGKMMTSDEARFPTSSRGDLGRPFSNEKSMRTGNGKEGSFFSATRKSHDIGEEDLFGGAYF